jgi:hypothetical protein
MKINPLTYTIEADLLLDSPRQSRSLPARRSGFKNLNTKMPFVQLFTHSELDERKGITVLSAAEK